MRFDRDSLKCKLGWNRRGHSAAPGSTFVELGILFNYCVIPAQVELSSTKAGIHRLSSSINDGLPTELSSADVVVGGDKMEVYEKRRITQHAA